MGDGILMLALPVLSVSLIKLMLRNVLGWCFENFASGPLC